MTFLLRYWKYLAGLLAVTLAFASGAHWQAGRDERKAANIAAQQAILDAVAFENYSKATQRAIKAEHDAQDANRKIYADLEPKLAVANDNGARLARLLHSATQAGANRCPVPTDTGVGSPSGPSGVAADSIEAATGAHFAACERDAVRLNALAAQIKGQM